jgi:hypothetical protein
MCDVIVRSVPPLRCISVDYHIWKKESTCGF